MVVRKFCVTRYHLKRIFCPRNVSQHLGSPKFPTKSETCGSQEFAGKKGWSSTPKIEEKKITTCGKIEENSKFTRNIINSYSMAFLLHWIHWGETKPETMRLKVNNIFLAWIFLGLEKPTSFWVWGDLGRFSIGSMKCVFVGNVGAVCHDFFLKMFIALSCYEACWSDQSWSIRYLYLKQAGLI